MDMFENVIRIMQTIILFSTLLLFFHWGGTTSKFKGINALLSETGIFILFLVFSLAIWFGGNYLILMFS